VFIEKQFSLCYSYEYNISQRLSFIRIPFTIERGKEKNQYYYGGIIGDNFLDFVSTLQSQGAIITEYKS